MTQPTGCHCRRPLMSKYGNKITVVDNITFHSKKEAKRYLYLKVLERGDHIQDLQLQPSFDIVVNDQHICKYIADFRYTEEGKDIIEDVKGGNATKTPVYKLKKKLMKAIYDIDILET